MKRFLILPLLAVTCLFAKDLGQSAATFPIEEESFIASMKSKAALHTAALKKYAEEIAEYIQNPTPIQGIGKAVEKRSSFYDPTYVVPEDIKIEGRLIAKAGTKINLLETMTFPGGMLFFDGSDPAQIAWAREQPADFKWVLVKGSPIALETQEQRPVHYDQLGYYTTRFQIHNVPAKVAQEGTVLLVEEIPVSASFIISTGIRPAAALPDQSSSSAIAPSAMASSFGPLRFDLASPRSAESCVEIMKKADV